MSAPKAIAFLVIGDEILSGRTQDVNVRELATRLNEIGANLAEVRMIPDQAEVIISTLRSCARAFDYVFTSGGIGPTHDDITADCVAASFDLGIDVRDDARAIMAANYENGEVDLTPARLRMARIPDGASLIKNPISGAPGFRVENVFTLAGVPAIFSAMLDDAIPQIEAAPPLQSQSHTIHLPESTIATPLGQIAAEFNDLSIGSYPQEENGRYFAEIVVKGYNSVRIEAAIKAIQSIQ